MRAVNHGGFASLEVRQYDLHGSGWPQSRGARRRAFEDEERGHSIGAVDRGRDGRAEARHRREMPEKRARSGFRVVLSHDSTVATYIQIHRHRKSHYHKQAVLLCGRERSVDRETGQKVSLAKARRWGQTQARAPVRRAVCIT